jgi:hypothetical protein
MATINSRADLDATEGTAEYYDFISYLKGTMLRKENIAAYPEDYNRLGYEGPEIEPVWVEIEDLSTITALGFTKAEINAIKYAKN